MGKFGGKTPKRWIEKIADGKKVKKVWADSFRVADLDKYYEGVQRPANWENETFLVINLIYSNVKVQLDNLVAATPRIYVRPARTFTPAPEMLTKLDEQVEKREQLLNYLIRENKLKKEIRKAALDAFVNFGVVKIFYEPFHMENPTKGQPMISKETRLPVTDIKTGAPVTQPDRLLIGELFEVERRNPDNIILDPFADSIENIEWVAERIEYTEDEFKKNPLFANNKDVKPFEERTTEDSVRTNEEERKRGTEVRKGSSVLNRPDRSESGEGDKIIVTWEIYDLIHDKLLTYAEGQNDKWLRNEPIPDSIEGHPYEFLGYILRRNSPYPIPEIWHQLGSQDEYNITRNQIITHRKRFNRKYEVKGGKIAAEELSKLEEPYDGLVIQTEGDGRSIIPIEDPGLDQAVYFDVDMLRRDFFDIAGTMQDTDVSKIQKATVGQIVQNRQEAKKRGKEVSIAEFIENIGYKLMLLIDHEMELPQAISVLGEAGNDWININPTDFKGGHGQFSYELAAGSLTPMTPSIQREQWLALLQVVQINPHIAMSETLLKKTAKMFGFEDKAMIAELTVIAQAMIKAQLEGANQQGQASQPSDRNVGIA